MFNFGVYLFQDYDQFDLANEIDTLEQFLKVELPPDNSLTENKVISIFYCATKSCLS